MAVFGQTRSLDVQFWRWIAVDGSQQFETALGSRRVTFLTVGPIAFQPVGGILYQGLALAGQGGERGALQLRGIGAYRQHLLLLAGVQRLGPLKQFALA
ncbi:hypothetical protein D3C77_551470 [compost metagenome]